MITATSTSQSGQPTVYYKYAEGIRLSGQVIVLEPQSLALDELTPFHPIVGKLRFQYPGDDHYSMQRRLDSPEPPILVGEVPDKQAFSSRLIPAKSSYHRNYPLRDSKGSSYFLPLEWMQFRHTIQMIINHQHAIQRELAPQWYPWLTVHQSIVRPGESQRGAGVHADGAYHTYVVSDCYPTHFYLQQGTLEGREIVFPAADEKYRHTPNPYQIVLGDDCSAHESPKIPEAASECLRTFVRLGYDSRQAWLNSMQEAKLITTQEYWDLLRWPD